MGVLVARMTGVGVAVGSTFGVAVAVGVEVGCASTVCVCCMAISTASLVAMAGTIALYDSEGERLHTIYMGATPEYGKEAFHTRRPL